MDMFSTRTMLAAVSTMLPLRTFLKDTFFPESNTYDTLKVDFDIKAGKREIAPYVHPQIGGKTIEDRSYQTKSYEPPEVSPDFVTTAENLLKRSAGEHVYGAKSPEERAQDKLADDLGRGDEMITRREEQQCSQAIFDGKIIVDGDGYDSIEINYWAGLPAQDQPYLELSGTDLWTDAGSNPSQSLKDAVIDVQKGSGLTPRDALIGEDAAKALLENETFLKNLDVRNAQFGSIDLEELPNGVTYIGYDKVSQLRLWTYNEWYNDPVTDELKPMVPVDKVAVISRDMETEFAYGMVEDADEGAFAVERLPVSWTQKKPSKRFIQVKSKPLAIIKQVLGLKVLKVV